MAPHRLAPAELRKLKTQLQELLDKEILVDPTKVETVIEWKQPKNTFEIRSFLGFASYYRRFKTSQNWPNQ